MNYYFCFQDAIENKRDVMKLGEPCEDEWADSHNDEEPMFSRGVKLKENVAIHYHFMEDV